jgi:hypothetical protein
LPFAGRLWWGEVPVLALIQLPKLDAADWFRMHVVLPVILHCGFSRGSFSPDYSLAGPYALAITYLIPVVIVGSIALYRRRSIPRQERLLVLAFLVAASVDYVVTLIVATGRSPNLF